MSEAIPGLKKIWIEMHESREPPWVGDFCVTVGRKTQKVGSVYHIATVREMKTKPGYRRKYMLGVLPAPELKEQTHYNPANERVWVNGTEAITMFWNPRKKKTK